MGTCCCKPEEKNKNIDNGEETIKSNLLIRKSLDQSDEGKNKCRYLDEEMENRFLKSQNYSGLLMQKQLNSEELNIIHGQTDKIYGDLENVIEIFAECLSYKKSEFNEEILANAKEKLEMKIDNSGYLYMALLKEAKKDKKHSEILLENLIKQKNVVLEKFKQLEQIIDFFGLKAEFQKFEGILKDEEFKPYEFKPMSFKDCSEKQLENVSTAINEIISKFAEIQNKKQQQIEEGKLPNEKEHQQIVDAQITGFQYKISHAPENDVLFLVNHILEDKNYNLLKQMIQENLINPQQVNGLIKILEEFKKKAGTNYGDLFKIEESIYLLNNYMKVGNILK